MVVPLFARLIAAAVGVFIVISAARSVIGTLIVPRAVTTLIIRRIDQMVDQTYKAVAALVHDRARRDRLLAGQVATLLIAQIVVWLLLFFVGYSLILWPMLHSGITTAFSTAGPALWEIGSERASGGFERAIIDIASLTGIVTVTLQIAYLPTLYSAFNRRETDVALLNARAGVPSWGPELLARTHYALGSGISTIDTLPQLYADWERWSADVAESHTTYLPLVRFRSPRPLSSWVTALLAVLDSAALILALSPTQAPTVAARLCLRSGFLCFRDIARTMGFDVPDEPSPDAKSQITYAEFLDAIARLRKLDFPIERDPEDAWPDFLGWRVNYEQAAYAIAYAVDPVNALWSGPRRHPGAPIAPIRPPTGRVKADGEQPDSKQPDSKAGAPVADSDRGTGPRETGAS